MTRSNIVAGILLAAFLIGTNAYGHTLDGVYGGQADGVDANGTELHQITKWTFNSGTLVAFREIISFGGAPTVACQFDASGNLPYTLDTLASASFVALGFGCPQPSTNNRPEAIVIVRENDGNEFSYLEYTANSSVSDQDVPAHFSGHAVAQKRLP